MLCQGLIVHPIEHLSQCSVVHVLLTLCCHSTHNCPHCLSWLPNYTLYMRNISVKRYCSVEWPPANFQKKKKALGGLQYCHKCDGIWEKGQFRTVAEFLFSIVHMYLQGCNSYSLETGYGDSSIIALHLLKILHPLASGEGVAIATHTWSKIDHFMPHFGVPPIQVRT